MDKVRIYNFFPGGNTVQGFYSLYQYLPYKTERAYILKGGPGTGKSTLMKKIGSAVIEQGYDIEYHWCSSDNDSLDGIVIPALRTAVFDGTAPHLIDPENPGAVEEIVNLGEFWDRSTLTRHRQEIAGINQQIKVKFQKVYQYLQIAGLLYQQWRTYYSEALDLTRVNRKIAALTNQLTASKSYTTAGTSRHLFASAITPEGPVNFFADLTAELKQRYLIKGEPGTGKTTLIKQIGNTFSNYGYEILYLHCGFNPTEIDGIIVPGEDLAVINATDPHPLEAARDGDQIVDMTACVNFSGVKKYTAELQEIDELFHQVMTRVYSFLQQAKNTHDQIEEYYVAAMDFNGIEEKRKEMLKEIMSAK